MEKLKKLSIGLIGHKENMSFAHKGEIINASSDPECKNGDLLLFFANMHNDIELLNQTVDILKPSNSELSVDLYLTETLNNLRPQFKDIKSEIIMVDTINAYVSEKKLHKKSVINIYEMLVDNFKIICSTANMLADFVYQSYQRQDDGKDKSFLLHLMIDTLGSFGGKVKYGVSPCFISGKRSFCDYFVVEDASSAMYLDFVNVARDEIIIKKCQNCSKYFLPSVRSDEVYCNNIFKNNKTCKDLGYENKINNDDILKAYRTAYKTKNAFKNRNMKNNLHAEDDFKNWVLEAKNKLNDTQEGTLPLEEFKQWLKT